MSSKVAPRQVVSFWNCYRPLLIWFQLVGISQISEIRSIFWRFAAICYTIAWLFFNIFSHIRTVLTFYLFYGTEDFSATSTYSWNASLVMGNWLLQDIGSHVALILIFQRNGSSLKKAFQNMDSSVPELYTKCRWAVLVCFVYIIVKVRLAIQLNKFNEIKFLNFQETVYIMFQMGWPVRNHSLLDNILLISCQVQYYYPSSIFALFCLLSFTISKNFESIRRQISEFQPTFLKVEDMATRLQQWKRRHAATCHCVEELNRTFGFYLLMETCSVFVGVISKFFYILVEVMEKGSVHRGNILFAIGHLFQLWTICYFTDDLRTQVVA